MAEGASFWITYNVTDSNGVSYTPYSNDFSSALSNAETAVFDDSSVTFYDYSNEEVWFTSFPNPYKYNGEYYPIDAVHCDGSDAQGGTFNVSGGCQIIVYYGKDPETGGSDVGGPNQGGNTPGSGSGGDSGDMPLDGDYAVDSNGNPLKASLNPFDIVIHYKDLEGNTVLKDTGYNNVFWVRRFDEGDINLEISESKEETADGTRYLITDRSRIQKTIANPPLILQRFDGLISNSGGVLYYEGKDAPYGIHEATAFYEPNSFDISIFINDSSRGKVVSTSNTNKEYPSGSTINDVYKKYPLKLTAVPNEQYRFGYWDVNNEKSYLSDLTYDVTSDTIVKCYFEEPIIPEDERIATNDYINSLFDDKNLYTINGDENSPYYELRCPTFWYIKNPDIDKSRPADIIQISQISNSYGLDQCVKEEDISILDKEIKLEFNDVDVTNLALSIISIYAAGDDPTKYNSIYAGDILLKSWRIERGMNGGETKYEEFSIPKNLTKVYNKKLKLEIIGYYGAKKNLKLYTNVNGSYVDRNSGGAVEISGSTGGTSNVILYGFRFNTFLNSNINPPIIRIEISK